MKDTDRHTGIDGELKLKERETETEEENRRKPGAMHAILTGSRLIRFVNEKRIRLR